MKDDSEKTDPEGSYMWVREKYMQGLTVAFAKNAEFISAQRGPKGGPWPE